MEVARCHWPAGTTADLGVDVAAPSGAGCHGEKGRSSSGVPPRTELGHLAFARALGRGSQRSGNFMFAREGVSFSGFNIVERRRLITNIDVRHVTGTATRRDGHHINTPKPDNSKHTMGCAKSGLCDKTASNTYS